LESRFNTEKQAPRKQNIKSNKVLYGLR